ncbi:MAG: ABC transporter permease [Lachnospiraceae bacterium]
MYYVKKLVSLITTILIITMLAFFAFSIVPGDAAALKLGTNATEEQLEALREEMGLNDNVAVRYVRWLKGTLTGDFGESSYYNMPVSELAGEKIIITLWLSLLAIIMIILIALPVAILASKKENGIVDRLISVTGQTLMAVPTFFMGILIILVLGLILRAFTVGGYVSYKTDFGGFLYYLLFPALAIAIPKIAMVVKFLRSNIIKEKNKDYVRTLWAFGTSEKKILWKNVLKNALLPTITFLGLVIADVLAGTVIAEQVFGIPGMGRLLVTSVQTRDYNVLQAIILFIGCTVVLLNFLVDISYHIIDPTVKNRN